MKKQKVCVVSGSRADYGLLKNLIGLLHIDKSFELKIAVTGPHLSPIWGETYLEIEKDGFKIDAKIETLLSSDTNVGMAKALGLGVLSFTDYFSQNLPDFIIVLGDRFEILAAAQAAYCLKIPVVHLHGGEVTSGALDDYFRHAITKLAHLHFVAHESYAKRVVQMGEQPNSVFLSGALGIDEIARVKKFSKTELEKRLSIPSLKQYFLITYHPATLSIQNYKEEQKIVKNICSALKEYKDYHCIVSLANADPRGYSINDTWKAEAQKSDRIKLYYHFGSELYLNVLANCSMVIGNSSSAILEAPYYHVPTINIGSRQDGRFHCSTIINCSGTSSDLKKAIAQAHDKAWVQKKVVNCPHPFGKPGTVAKTIMSKLKQIDFSKLEYKKFYDIK